MDITTATPSEIDTALAEVYGRYYSVLAQAEQQTKFIKDLRDGLAKKAAGKSAYQHWSESSLEPLVAKRAALWDQSREILEESLPYEAEYTRRGGWSRFYLVQNNGGHIHSSQRCNTCYITTQFGWLPSVSGQTEAEAVAEFGAILCTVCFPSAPSEYTDRHDDSVCSGSGKHYDSSQPSRTGFYTGNWGVCTGCGERQTITKTGNIRKHKKA